LISFQFQEVNTQKNCYYTNFQTGEIVSVEKKYGCSGDLKH